jgi:hypothetical protein
MQQFGPVCLANRTKRFHVKHFGAIGGSGKKTWARGHGIESGDLGLASQKIKQTQPMSRVFHMGNLPGQRTMARHLFFVLVAPNSRSIPKILRRHSGLYHYRLNIVMACKTMNLNKHQPNRHLHHKIMSCQYNQLSSNITFYQDKRDIS